MFEIIFLAGLVILIGLASRWVFEKTRIPQVIILLLIGFVLGPLGLVTYFNFPNINQGYFQNIAPVIGAVAIILMVFDAGIRLRLKELRGDISFSVFFTFINLAATIGLVSLVLHFIFHWAFLDSVIFASIVGGLSSFAAYSILPLVRTTNNLRSSLYLEGIISTIAIGIGSIGLMRYAQLSAQSPIDLGNLLFYLFSISFIFGLVVALLILFLISHFNIKKFGYFSLFALLLIVYSVDFVYLGGIGIISVIVMGIVLANAEDLFKFLKKPAAFEIDESFRSFQREISLFINTFFFVYLGLIFRLSDLNLPNVLLAILLVSCMLVIRAAVIYAMGKFLQSQEHENLLRAIMVPRDLLSATLATFVLVYPVSTDFSIGLVCLIILFSTIVTTGGLNYYERKYRDSFLYKKEIMLRDGREVVIRSFTMDDFGKLRQFFNELVAEGAYIALDQQLSSGQEREIDEASIIKMNKKEMIVWVCQYQNRLVARAVAEKMPRRERDNVSLSFYVAKDFRGAGLGTYLIRTLVKEAIKLFNPHNLYLTVYSSNKDAIKLYLREGFVKRGVLPDWMKHKGEYLDRVYMVYDAKSKKAKRRN